MNVNPFIYYQVISLVAVLLACVYAYLFFKKKRQYDALIDREVDRCQREKQAGNSFGNVSAPGAKIISIVTTNVVWLRALKQYLDTCEPMMASAEEEFFVSPITPLAKEEDNDQE